MQMQMHLDQMQMHLDQMQMLFCNYILLPSASDILLNDLLTNINKKTLINNNNKMMGVSLIAISTLTSSSPL